MAQNSKIEWCDHTANLWHGCTKVHAGCDHCYAETLSHRWGNDVWGNDKPRKAIQSVWSDLEKFQKAAAAKNEIHRVFVGSMMDIFEKSMPLIDSKGEPVWIADVVRKQTRDLRKHLFEEVIPASPNLLFLLLTKRPSNINKYIPEEWKINPPKNVMFGTSPCDQETANILIPQLLDVNGYRFLSVEPMIGPVNICEAVRIWQFKTFGSFQSTFFGDKIHWVIVGGESGHGKRPFVSDWARELRDDCRFGEAAFFMKQIDKVQPIPEDLMIREFPILNPLYHA